MFYSGLFKKRIEIQDELRSMSSGSSSGYGSAGTVVEVETASSAAQCAVVTHVNVRSPVCSMSHYPSSRPRISSDSFVSNGSAQLSIPPVLSSDGQSQSQPDLELLPSINDFQFPISVSGISGAASTHTSQQLARNSPTNYDVYCNRM